jgi:S-formylglutathione hydrolase FrmB
MLHGINGNYNEWVLCGLISTADELIRDGKIPPMIIALPQGDRGYYINQANGGPRWADYITEEVVPMMDSSYRTLASRDSRAIGGDSMGGHGALQLAMNHPDLFSVVGAHSPALRRQSETFPFFGDAAYFAKWDPISLAKAGTGSSSLRIWIDTGTGDPWRNRATELHQLLLAQGVAHTWHVLPGRHDPSYWQAHVGDYLGFYAAALGAGSPVFGP